MRRAYRFNAEEMQYVIDNSDATIVVIDAEEAALFTIEKRPKLRARQGEYAVIEASGRVMKRGHDLAQVLRVFDKKLFKAVAAQTP